MAEDIWYSVDLPILEALHEYGGPRTSSPLVTSPSGPASILPWWPVGSSASKPLCTSVAVPEIHVG